MEIGDLLCSPDNEFACLLPTTEWSLANLSLNSFVSAFIVSEAYEYCTKLQAFIGWF